MDREEYAIMFQAEDHHWWYQGMARITRALLGRWYLPGQDLRILDAGCGTGGAMTGYLAEYGEVTGFDFSEEALRFCRLRGAGRLVRASVQQMPFTDAAFDLVASLDVLYERGVPDDLGALREFGRVLVPGGRALLRLPAYDWLRGRHDTAVHSRRRYTSQQVADLLFGAGFGVEHISYANTFLFPLALAKRLGERISTRRDARSDLTMKVQPLNGLLRLILAAEAPLVTAWGLPFGLSVVAVGRKSPNPHEAGRRADREAAVS